MPGYENDIPPRSYLIPLNSGSYRFAHPTFDLVPIHRLANPPPYCKTEATVLPAIGQYRHHQQPMNKGAPLAPVALKVGIRSQTVLSAHGTTGSGLEALRQR
jgi:hypothetical protein